MKLPIETERLLMRPKTLDDVEPMHAVFADPEVMRYIGNGKIASKTLADTQWRVERHMGHQERHGYSMWTLVLRETGEVIGDCGLMTEFTEPDVEVGYRLARAHWGHGYATEAARATVERAFADLPLERLIALTHPGNTASQRVLEKAGFDREGLTDAYYGLTTVLFTRARLD